MLTWRALFKSSFIQICQQQNKILADIIKVQRRNTSLFLYLSNMCGRKSTFIDMTLICMSNFEGKWSHIMAIQLNCNYYRSNSKENNVSLLELYPTHVPFVKCWNIRMHCIKLTSYIYA